MLKNPTLNLNYRTPKFLKKIYDLKWNLICFKDFQNISKNFYIKKGSGIIQLYSLNKT